MFCPAWWVSIKFSTFNQGCATTFMRSPLALICNESEVKRSTKMKTRIFFTLSIFTLISCLNREFSAPHRMEDVNNLDSRIRNVLNEDWIILYEKNLTNIYFCPTCNDPDSNSNIPAFSFFFAESQLKLKGPDSVAFLTAVNPPTYQTKDELMRYIRPDGILKIMIRYEDKWSESKYERVKSMNDTLIAELKANGLSPEKYSSFSDFRANIPDSSKWHKYLTKSDYYFQRLPYNSSITDKSILIDDGLPYDWSYPFYVDKTDSLYYLNKKNSMLYEHSRIMYCIAYALGIEDYEYPL